MDRIEEIGPYVDDLHMQSRLTRLLYWLDVFGKWDYKRRAKMIMRQERSIMARRWEEVKRDRQHQRAREREKALTIPHPGHYQPQDPDYSRPVVSPQMLERWRGYRICVKVDGGHFWHPIGMIDWECCQCGIQTDGSPKDGHRAGIFV